MHTATAPRNGLLRRWSPAWLLLIGWLLSGCSHHAPLRVYPDDVPPGSLRLVQALVVGTRADIVGEKSWHDALLRSGIADRDIGDGSMAVGRICCCGGTAEVPMRQAFCIPPGLPVKPLDIVEIRAGREPAASDPGRVNQLTRVVQPAGGGATTCRWEPQDPGLWMRVLYCDWMPQEGWIELKTTLNHTWYKPPSSPAK